MSASSSQPVSKRAGLTLLEVLIAVTLVSLLSAAGLVALRIGLNAMERSNSRLMGNRRALGAQRALEQQIAGFMPVTADCSQGNPAGPGVRVPFFQGEPDAMRFVSSYSLEEASRGLPRILEYQVIAGEEGEGVRLVVTEYLYSGPRSTGSFCLGFGPDPMLGVTMPRWLPARPGPQSFVLADKLAFCRFSYRESLQVPPYERWHARWTLPRWPTALRIEMTPLRPDRARLLPMSIAVPLRAQKDPMVSYAE